MNTLDLKNVTLVTIDTVNDWENKSNPRLACISKIIPNLIQHLHFGDVLCINPFSKNKHYMEERFPVLWDYDFETMPRNIMWYNNFMVRKLPFLIKTDYYLIIQWDGFPINIDKFDRRFFDYDYLGGGHSFLNGGFSLRKTSTMRILASETDTHGMGSEDGFYSAHLDHSWNENRHTNVKMPWPWTQVLNSFCVWQAQDFPTERTITSFGWHRNLHLTPSLVTHFYRMTGVFSQPEIEKLTDLCFLKNLYDPQFNIENYAIEYNEEFFQNY